MDDRKAKELRDEMERQQRQARATAAASSPAPSTARTSSRVRVSTPESTMPGSGHILSETVNEHEGTDAHDEPPAYEHQAQ